MIPQCPVASYPILELEGIFHGLFLVSRILFGLAARRRIDFLQFGDCEGSLLGIVPRIALVKIGQLRLSFLKLCDDQSHLQAPVPQMDISDNFIPRKTGDSLNAFPDDGRTQMPHMQGLRHIRSAIIHDDGLFFSGHFHSEFFTGFHLLQISAQKIVRQLQVQESGSHRFHLGKNFAVF